MAQVLDLSVEKSAHATTILVHASGLLRYQTQMLSNPTRLVVDLPETLLLARRRNIAIDADPVVGLRTAQFQAKPPVTRLVVDLQGEVSYTVEAVSPGLKVTLLHAAQSAPASAADAGPKSQTPVLLASLAPVIPARTAAELPEAPAPGAVASSEPPATAGTMARKEDSASPTSAQAPSVPTTPVPQQASPAAKTTFGGEPISVNLKDVDLKDFFRLIHEISGLNIVLDPAVSGSVTLVLDEVPWDQALDLVLKNNGLGMELQGNVLRIATIGNLKKEEENRRDLAKARAEAIDPVQKSIVLSYAKAGDLEATLRKFLSSRGEIIRDDRTNTLIIRDIPDVIPQIDNLIKQLDRKSPQVEIEARVVTASRSFARELGVQLALSASPWFRNSAGTAIGGDPRVGGSATQTGTGVAQPVLNVETAPPLVSSFPATVDSSAGFGFQIATRERTFALDLFITAAESRGVGKLLSKPRVITQDNVKALVQQGVRIPVQTVVNNTVSTQLITVVLKLEVTPHVTADGTIFLNIDVTNEAINPGIARINGIPALDTQQATTQVLVNDGGTVVIGGVMTTETSFDVNQVPLLGSVPVIGHLFKRTRVSTRSSELLFFITPRILPT